MKDDDKDKNARPLATKMIAGVGTELVEFTGKPLILENKVEEYLNDIILKMQETLFTIGKNCLKDDREGDNKANWIENYPS